VGREKVSHKSGSLVCTIVRACGDVWVDSCDVCLYLCIMCVYKPASNAIRCSLMLLLNCKCVYVLCMSLSCVFVFLLYV